MRKYFSLHDIFILLWLLGIQPFLLKNIPAISFETIPQYGAFLMLALIANFLSMGLTGVLFQYRWLKGQTGDTYTGIGFLFHPTMLIVINACFTITLISIGLAFSNLEAWLITLIVVLSITALLLFFAFISNFVGEKLDLNRWFEPLNILKDLLSAPAVIMGAELCRQMLAPVFWTTGEVGITAGNIIMLITYLFLLAPLGYYLLIFIFRAPLELKSPGKSWFLQYLLFIIGLFLNVELFTKL
jgi:hypothetical protein